MTTEPQLPRISAGQLRQRLLQGQKPGEDFLLVDVRDDDCKGGTVQGAMNIPMETVAAMVPSLLALTDTGNTGEVIFYCGSSSGRGPRAAALLSEEVKRQSRSSPQAAVLAGGIKSWVAGGKEYTDLMDGYDPGHWTAH